MASRATSHWRSMLNAMGQNRSFASSTTPKFAPASGVVHPHHEVPKSKYFNADFAPIMLLGGFILVVGSIGVHTVYQQLVYSPQVHVSKKKRETVPEVSDPDTVALSGDKFINKSFLRKVGNIQEKNPAFHDPMRPDPFTQSREIESLKSAGVRN